MKQFLTIMVALVYLPLTLADIPTIKEAMNIQFDGTKVTLKAKNGVYFYRDKIKIFINGDQILPKLAQAMKKTDDFFGEQLIYRNNLDISLGNFFYIKTDVHFQACHDVGICYPPQKTSFYNWYFIGVILAIVAILISFWLWIKAKNRLKCA